MQKNLLVRVDIASLSAPGTSEGHLKLKLGITFAVLAIFGLGMSAMAAPSKGSASEATIQTLLLSATPSSGRLTVKTAPTGKTVTLAKPRTTVQTTYDLRKQKNALLRSAPELSQPTK